MATLVSSTTLSPLNTKLLLRDQRIFVELPFAKVLPRIEALLRDRFCPLHGSAQPAFRRFLLDDRDHVIKDNGAFSFRRVWRIQR